MPQPSAAAVALLAAALLPALTGRAAANERHFTYTYESAVLPEGVKELEVWTTARLGRDEGSYRAYDQRLEIEAGLTDRLMGALYLNAVTEHTDAGTVSVLDGVSWEMKYRHLDATADAIGLATYLELTHGPDESELELKLILDQRRGGWLWAANLVVEEEMEDPGGENELEHGFEVDFGLAAELGEWVTLGVEVRGAGAVEGGEFEGVALFAGPVLAAHGKAMWAALTVTPQLGALGGEGGGFERNLEEQEMLQARLLAGYHF